MKRKSGVSRRDFLKTGALAGAAAAGGLGARVAEASERGAAQREQHHALVLVNGRIHTLDDRDSVVSSVAIANGRFVAVGNGARETQGAQVINLRGRTVVPGLIESHTHFVSLANRPGYHVVLERARNIREVQELLAARRAAKPEVPEAGFITAMGGWSPNQWAERRLPTRGELDAAVSDRPVFLYQGGIGPARVNSRGEEFFRSVSNPTVSVVDGVLAVADANAALYHLRIRQSLEDKKRSAFDAQAYSAAVGVTALLDQTLVALSTGTLDPASLEPQPTHFLFNLNHYRMYDGWLALHADGGSLVRLQMNFLHNQGFIDALGPLERQLPELRERLKNQFRFFGDDMLRTGGIGEWAAPFAPLGSGNAYDVWLLAQRLCAQARWRNENARTSEADIQQVVDTYRMMDEEFGIQELRWGLQHGDFATPAQLQALKDLNCGLSTSGFRWTATKPPASGVAGPLFPQIFESGVNVGLHEDGVHIAPHNPWFALHYATTGLNVFGVQINPGQQINRQQALRAYTRGNAWYLNRDHDLGSIEKGKLADLVVLDKDYFTVSDAEMREIRPILTVVDGNVVHDSGLLD